MRELTKKALMNSVVNILAEKPLDKITIKDIVDECGVNRSTFYYYYEDIYALLEDIFKTEIDNIVERHKDYTTWQDGFIESAEFVLKNKKAVYHVYNSMGRDYLENYLFKITEDLMIKYVSEEAKDMAVSEDDIKFVALFYQYALKGFIMDWIKNNMKDDPRETVKKLAQTFDGSIKAALEKRVQPSKDHTI